MNFFFHYQAVFFVPNREEMRAFMFWTSYHFDFRILVTRSTLEEDIKKECSVSETLIAKFERWRHFKVVLYINCVFYSYVLAYVNIEKHYCYYILLLYSTIKLYYNETSATDVKSVSFILSEYFLFPSTQNSIWRWLAEQKFRC